MVIPTSRAIWAEALPNIGLIRRFSISAPRRADVNIADSRFRKGRRAAGVPSQGPLATSPGHSPFWVKSPELTNVPQKPLTSDVSSIGSVHSFDPTILKAFDIFGLPKDLKNEFMFSSRPSTLIRDITCSLMHFIGDTQTGSSKDHRIALTGPLGCGKSILLLQALAYARSRNRIIFYVPNAIDLVSSKYAHTYSNSQQIYVQDSLSRLLVERLAEVNAEALKKMKVKFSREIEGARGWKQGDELYRAIKDSIGGRSSHAQLLETVLDEIASQNEFPMLLAIDNFQALLRTSDYSDPNFRPIESFGLSVPRLLLEYISATKSFQRGMILLAPSSREITHRSPTLPSAIGLRPPVAFEDLGNHPAVYSSMVSGVKSLELPHKLHMKEAEGLLRMWDELRAIRGVSDGMLMEKYIASDGNPRQFVDRIRNSMAW